MLDRDRQARLRAAWPASGLAPWATADHAADLRRALAALPISPHVAVTVRASDGQPWAVTRVSYSTYQATHRDGRHALGALDYVVDLMEPQPPRRAA